MSGGVVVLSPFLLSYPSEMRSVAVAYLHCFSFLGENYHFGALLLLSVKHRAQDVLGVKVERARDHATFNQAISYYRTEARVIR